MSTPISLTPTIVATESVPLAIPIPVGFACIGEGGRMAGAVAPEAGKGIYVVQVG